jgi:hypothetical protein
MEHVSNLISTAQTHLTPVWQSVAPVLAEQYSNVASTIPWSKLAPTNIPEAIVGVYSDPLSTFLSIIVIYVALSFIISLVKGAYRWVIWLLKMVVYSAVLTSLLYGLQFYQLQQTKQRIKSEL